jgi:hypothetical protein
MASTEQATRDTLTAPPLLRLGFAVLIGLLGIGAAYLYAVRGTVIFFDLANGLGRMMCL